MASRNRKALYLLLAAGALWLRYAKSAEPARLRLKGAGDSLRNVLSTLEERSRQMDEMLQEIISTGRELTSQAESVLTGTLQRIEETAAVIQENVTLSSCEITSMVRDVRAAVGNLTHSRPHAA